MVTRIGHMGMRVRDLDAAVAFHRDVLGLVETERVGSVAYLSCNARHHELVLIQDTVRGYDHIALEVPDADTLEAAVPRLHEAGARLLADVYDGEPGIERALLFTAPEGHVFKLFCGMEEGGPQGDGDRPVKFEHVSLKVRNLRRMERFLQDGLGFSFSDRMGPLASWWHCDADHHGIALVLAPRAELAHYAWACADFGALGRTADRLRAIYDRRLVWGPSRHGPGNNHFIYLEDADGALIECCSELAQLGPGSGYQPRSWPIGTATLNQWGAGPPLRFLLAAHPIAAPDDGHPWWACAPRGTAVAAG